MAIKRSLLLILLLISVSLSTARILPGEFSPVSKEVVGCGGDAAEIKTEYSFVPEVVTGKFGSLVLNALPRGRYAVSGPSKKTHDVQT
ncbi:hypothetical protein AALP_AA3G118500 [Arabis alpina]|uniref:Uncharacterized protein n=1 Tax=Arabis alpina TaxID=50452 RepID=A0A087H8M9_ARAAL|nr:hypothetical protein AALP_AA3G118500 [Arabis alpina]